MGKNVREAAAALHAAISEAKAAGYHITWPSNAEGLSSIAISETAKVKAVPAKPATFGTAKT